MFKNTSNNMESRARRSVISSALNKEFDETAFKSVLEKELQAAREAKKIAEGQISYYKNQITVAKNTAAAKGSYVPAKTFNRWLESLERSKQEMYATELKISGLKTKLKPIRKAEDDAFRKSFAEQFVRTAKDMLAEPVFEKLRIATLHVVSEPEISD